MLFKKIKEENRPNDEYLALLAEYFTKALDELKPDIIIYNAETDIFQEDPVGNMNITHEGIIKRDEYVFRSARAKQIPIVMVLSGGYSPKNAHTISVSIENILKNIIAA